MNSKNWYVAALFLGGCAAMWFGWTEFMRTGDARWIVAMGFGFGVLIAAGIFLHVGDKPAPPDNFEGRAHVDIDWHLSDVCLRVTCPCTTPAVTRHLDGYTFGRFRCPECKTSYRIVLTLPAYRTDSSRSDRELRPVK